MKRRCRHPKPTARVVGKAANLVRRKSDCFSTSFENKRRKLTLGRKRGRGVEGKNERMLGEWCGLMKQDFCGLQDGNCRAFMCGSCLWEKCSLRLLVGLQFIRHVNPCQWYHGSQNDYQNNSGNNLICNFHMGSQYQKGREKTRFQGWQLVILKFHFLKVSGNFEIKKAGKVKTPQPHTRHIVSLFSSLLFSSLLSSPLLSSPLLSSPLLSSPLLFSFVLSFVLSSLLSRLVFSSLSFSVSSRCRSLSLSVSLCLSLSLSVSVSVCSCVLLLWCIVVCCVLCLVSCVLCLVSRVSCLVSRVSCLVSRVSCLVSRVSCLVSRVSCLVSRVSCLVSRVSCLVSCVLCLVSCVLCGVVLCCVVLCCVVLCCVVLCCVVLCCVVCDVSF